MRFVSPQSSFIHSGSYNRRKGVLTINIVEGKVMRRYRFDVPQVVAIGLATAPSAGKYFNTVIKPHYASRLVA